MNEISPLGRYIDNQRRFPFNEDIRRANYTDDGEPKYTIGQTIRAWRNARGYSITELARRSGPPITKPYLSVVEHAKIRGNVSELRKVLIANGLEINVGYLDQCIVPPNPSFKPPK